MFDERGMALDPVTTVAVERATVHADFGMVDVAADHAVHAAFLRFFDDGVFKATDVIHGIFDFMFEQTCE